MSYRSTIYRNKPGAKPAKDMERDGKKKEDGEAREKMTETRYAVGPHWKKLKYLSVKSGKMNTFTVEW